MIRRSLAIALVALSWSCSRPPSPQGPSSRVPGANPEKTVRGVDSPELARWVERYHEARYQKWPRRSVEEKWRDRLESVSPKSYAHYWKELDEIRQGLAKVELKALTKSDRISYDMLLASIETQLQLSRFKPYQITFSSDSGFFQELAGMHMQQAFDDKEDYLNYLARLQAVPSLIDEHIENMKAGLERKFTAPLSALPAALSNIAAEKDRAAEASPFYRPFQDMRGEWSEEEQRKLRIQAREVIATRILPAYETLYQFLDKTYRPHARTAPGVWSLPDGPEYYQSLIRKHTDGELLPLEIHEIGLKEVRRIEEEMKAIRESTGFSGSQKDFLKFLRSDPQFYAKTPRELLMHASYIAKRIDAQLLNYFHRLPPRPYGVFPVPDAIAPYYTAGRYAPAAALTRDPAQYWVNTHNLPSRPLYALPALTAHESVPGHHLQISRHQALADLPAFRRESGSSAYIEGWALYSERLAKEMGIYESPYEDFGRLNYEMWRACRLVVDTGIHALKWSREQAIQFMLDHTALSEHEVQTEVDRYISWPAQALSYKLGEIEISKLRREAEKKLGSAFDLRDFHERILEAGPIPLSSLRQSVERWIQSEQRSFGLKASQGNAGVRAPL